MRGRRGSRSGGYGNSFDVGGLESTTCLAGLGAGVCLATIGEFLVADVVGESVKIVGDICRHGAVGADALIA